MLEQVHEWMKWISETLDILITETGRVATRDEGLFVNFIFYFVLNMDTTTQFV